MLLMTKAVFRDRASGVKIRSKTFCKIMDSPKEIIRKGSIPLCIPLLKRKICNRYPAKNMRGIMRKSANRGWSLNTCKKTMVQ
jgi:hypothetical protein